MHASDMIGSEGSRLCAHFCPRLRGATSSSKRTENAAERPVSIIFVDYLDDCILAY